MLNFSKTGNAPTPASTQLQIMEENYQEALKTIKRQNEDIQRLISALLLQGVNLPGDILNRYLKYDSYNISKHEDED